MSALPVGYRNQPPAAVCSGHKRSPTPAGTDVGQTTYREVIVPKTKGPLVAALLLAGLALTGCTTAPAPEPTDQATVTMDEPTPTAAPLTAETPAADSGDAQFLTYVREKLPANTVIPNATDEQLLSAGMEACERLRSGETSDTISVIDGEQRNGADIYADSGVIITGARLALCTDQG
jgi:hypothetical protein